MVDEEKTTIETETDKQRRQAQEVTNEKELIDQTINQLLASSPNHVSKIPNDKEDTFEKKAETTIIQMLMSGAAEEKEEEEDDDEDDEVIKFSRSHGNKNLKRKKMIIQDSETEEEEEESSSDEVQIIDKPHRNWNKVKPINFIIY